VTPADYTLRRTTQAHTGRTVVTVTGEIDLTNADDFATEITHLPGPGPTIVDFTRLRYLDSARLRRARPDAGRWHDRHRPATHQPTAQGRRPRRPAVPPANRSRPVSGLGPWSELGSRKVQPIVDAVENMVSLRADVTGSTAIWTPTNGAHSPLSCTTWSSLLNAGKS